MIRRNQTLWLIVLIVLAGFALRQLRMFDYPFFGDELKNGDIALEILGGNIAPFYPHAHGREALYGYSMAAAFALLGDNVLANRWPSVLWSVLLIPLMYAYGRRLFESRRIGLLCAALTAGLWWAAVFAHSGLRVVSLPVLLVPALIGLFELTKRPMRHRAAVWGGLFAGLAAYTYISGRGFPVVMVAFLLYVAIFHRPQWHTRTVATYVGLTGIVSAWLYIYLRQNPALDSRMGLASYGIDLMRSGAWAELGNNVGRTLGMFTQYGDPVWLYNVSGRPVLPGPAGWIFVAGVVYTLLNWRKPAYMLQLILFGVMLGPTLLTPLAPDSATTRAIGILPALVVMTVLPFEWGWGQLSRWPRWRLPYSALVVVLLASVYLQTANDMLNRWMDDPGVYGMTVAQYVETAEFVNRSDTMQINFNMPVYHPWRATNIDRPIRRPEVASYRVRYQALVWADVTQPLSVAFERNEPPHPLLRETFFNGPQPDAMGTRIDSSGEPPLHVHTVAPLADRLAAAGEQIVAMPYSAEPLAISAEFDQVVRLAGYELLPASDTTLAVLTYWDVLQTPPDMAIFMHLLDANSGELVSQHDGFDVITSELNAGDTVVQLHTIPIETLPAGMYRLQLGAYRRDNLQRLPINVEPQDQILWLDTWQK